MTLLQEPEVPPHLEDIDRDVIEEFMRMIEIYMLRLTYRYRQPWYPFVIAAFQFIRRSINYNQSHSGFVTIYDRVIEVIGLIMALHYIGITYWPWYQFLTIIVTLCIKDHRIRNGIVQGIIWFIRRVIDQGIWISGVLGR